MESSYFRCELVGGRQEIHRFLSKVKKKQRWSVTEFIFSGNLSTRSICTKEKRTSNSNEQRKHRKCESNNTTAVSLASTEQVLGLKQQGGNIQFHTGELTAASTTASRCISQEGGKAQRNLASETNMHKHKQVRETDRKWQVNTEAAMSCFQKHFKDPYLEYFLPFLLTEAHN